MGLSLVTWQQSPNRVKKENFQRSEKDEKGFHSNKFISPVQPVHGRLRTYTHTVRAGHGCGHPIGRPASGCFSDRCASNGCPNTGCIG
jgi:hypothetical protein